jgi:ATP-dependent DNA helicase RecG
MTEQHAGESAADIELSTEVQFLKHVGPRRAPLLSRLGLATAGDVLFFFPRDYEQLGEQCQVDQLEEGATARIVGTVCQIDTRRIGRRKKMLVVQVEDPGGRLNCVWFNQPFMRDKFEVGQRVMISGQVKQRDGSWEITHPRTIHLEEGESPPETTVLPVYPLTEGLSQFHIRRIISDVARQLVPTIEEVFPASLLKEKQLLPIQPALEQIHHPQEMAEVEQARYRFVYQEFLALQLALALRRWSLSQDRQAAQLPASEKIHRRILDRFPFQLTTPQERVIAEISSDMALQVPMNRLLQGDVGSGKTVVAEYAMLLAVAHGYQAVLMAPTEILVMQHLRTLQQDLSESQVRIASLTGSLSTADRRQTLADLRDGTIDLVVGTHALGHEDVQFQGLGLVVIDEQHKFGVQQRAVLKKTALAPHYLVMTATPIPRTVSMVLFGDLEVSLLESGPGDQRPVQTRLAESRERAEWWEFYRRTLREGRQGYVITPLVDASDDAQLAGVKQTYEALANGELEEFRLGLIHGRLPAEQKNTVMQQFADGAIQVLVATSVVEVGVNVPNATIMTIEDGQQFGLAQLHQLRGRIRRGKHEGFLCVFADPATEESHQRLEALVEIHDGFKLAEVDFELRGPGDLFSTRQHGLPPFRIARLPADFPILEEARQDARRMLRQDPGLQNPQLATLRRRVLIRYGDVLDLGDVG